RRLELRVQPGVAGVDGEPERADEREDRPRRDARTGIGEVGGGPRGEGEPRAEREGRRVLGGERCGGGRGSRGEGDQDGDGGRGHGGPCPVTAGASPHRVPALVRDPPAVRRASRYARMRSYCASPSIPASRITMSPAPLPR